MANLTTQMNDFRSVLLKMKDQIALALPKHMDRDRLLRVVLTTVQRTPAILSCTQHSVLAAIMQSAQLGLEPDSTLGHCYLIPYGNHCQLIIGYKGLIELARRSGVVSSVRAHIVQAGDLFEYELGLTPKLRHVPQDVLELNDRQQREKILGALGNVNPNMLVAAYAVIDLKDGGQHFEVVTKSFVDRIRAVSQSGRSASSPWATWEDQMWRKTAIKQGLKYVPLSPEDKLSTALQADERTFVDFSQTGELVSLEAPTASALDSVVANAAGTTAPSNGNGQSLLTPVTPGAPKTRRPRSRVAQPQAPEGSASEAEADSKPAETDPELENA
jgi:recombination protein RecT